MRALLLPLATAVLVCSPLPGQKGTYTPFGSACAGSGAPGCISANWGQAFRGNTGSAALFGLPFNTGNTVRIVCAVELFCKTRNNNTANMGVWIYDRTPAGQPGKAIASSTMRVTGVAKANRATFPQPVILTANTNVFIVLDNKVGLNLPIMRTGTRNQHLFLRNGTWAGPFTSVNWNYNIVCCGGGGGPVISSTGVPTINASFSADLSRARANAAALLALGLKKTNIDLRIIGAPGCTLYTDPLIVLGLKTGGSGTLSFKLNIPNDTNLLGQVFYNQFAVDDPINALNLVFTTGAEGKVGK